jgi:hypothetical protein
MESGSTPPRSNGGKAPDDRIPRGAIAVVVVGVIACIAAALLTGGSKSGEAAHLEFVQQAKIPASKPVSVPGAKEGAQMELAQGQIEATGTNVAGYSLFRVLTTVDIDKGAPIGKGKLICSTHATRSGTLIAQSYGGLRALYPRSSEEGIYGQQVPETVSMKFASHGYEYAVVEVGGVAERFTTIEGVKLSWPEYEEGTEHLEYFLPEGAAPHRVELPFYTIWKSTKPGAATVSCTLETGSGKATVHTEGQLDKLSPPINEEEESAESEAAEEEVEESEEEG